MSEINTVSLTGNITKDIELKATTSGMNVANLTVAVSGYKDGNTSFIDCVAFGKTAEIASKYLRKGNKAGISGRLQQRSYEKDGIKRSVTEVVVDNLVLLTPKEQATSSVNTRDYAPYDVEDSAPDIMAIPF